MKITYLSSEFCGPCKQFYPVVEKFCGDFGIELTKIDVIEAEGLVKEFNVKAIPFLIIFEGDKEIYRGVGVLPEKELKRICCKD